MGEKYGSLVGRFHLAKESFKDRWSNIKETGGINAKANEIKEDVIKKMNHGDEQYEHLYRRKSRWELTRISSAVMGIEFSYAAETAFVSPTLLKIGVLHKHMTLIWCLSPLVGFFCTPILGSISDRCRSNLGRRRPFIILLSVGVVLGLILVPNGKLIGQHFGDRYPSEEAWAKLKLEKAVSGGKNISLSNPKIRGGDDTEGPGGRLAGWNREDYDYDNPEENAEFELNENKFGKKFQPGEGNRTSPTTRRRYGKGHGSRMRWTTTQRSTTPDGAGENEEYDYEENDENDDSYASTTSPKKAAKTTGYSQHPWGIFFTILGTVLLDFDADACQSPSRAYLLDVTVPEDHAIGLSTFTIMAGLGGSLGYMMGGIDWGVFGDLFGGHVRLVFTLVLFIFVACVYVTLTSFSEIPLDILASSSPEFVGKTRRKSSHYNHLPDEGHVDEVTKTDPKFNQYGSFDFEEQQPKSANPFEKKASQHQFTNGQYSTVPANENDKKFLQVAETTFSQASPMAVEEGEEAKRSVATLREYLWSIIYMPSSLRILCLTNLFCWMSLVCYSLYFTDYVGEAVFGGNPAADPGTKERRLYDEGVRFGCWGMAMYSFSCSCYSFIIERLVKRFRAKPVYVCGQLVYCVGMIFMALSRSKWGVLLFSWSAGVMYSTLFTMPYLLVAHYHETDMIQCEDVWFLRQIRKLCARIKAHRKGGGGEAAMENYHDSAAEMSVRKRIIESQVRGIGTDVGIVSSMVFLAQFILSLSMGSIINAVQSTTAVVVAASVLSFCGAISANFVTYLDL